ncbi:MAG TPA: nitroreductase family protein [Spirochaetota bacterium]|nr:nitroreductase family protein [Spirochaetota bacterium]
MDYLTASIAIIERFVMNFEDFFEILENRRSIRKYTSQNIDKEDIKKIILSGIQAPSGTNIQGWKFRVIENKEEILKIANVIEKKIIKLSSEYGDGIVKNGMLEYGGNFYFFKNAPLIILLYSKKPNNLVKKFFEEGINLYKGCGTLLSLGMVMQNMMLASSVLGIGSCPLTGPLLAEKEIDAEFSPPNKYELSAVLSLGYPEAIPKSPGRKEYEKFIFNPNIDSSD